MKAKPSIYVETSVISYLAAPPSRDLISLARQAHSHDFWKARSKFDLYSSDLVVDEASKGNAAKVKGRTAYLTAMTLLATGDLENTIADYLIRGAALPTKARDDAVHIAIAACAGLDYILSWNFKHIVNPITLPLTHRILSAHKIRPPVICTPEHLLELLP
jgi:hypothetical protein